METLRYDSTLVLFLRSEKNGSRVTCKGGHRFSDTAHDTFNNFGMGQFGMSDNVFVSIERRDIERYSIAVCR